MPAKLRSLFSTVTEGKAESGGAITAEQFKEQARAARAADLEKREKRIAPKEESDDDSGEINSLSSAFKRALSTPPERKPVKRKPVEKEEEGAPRISIPKKPDEKAKKGGESEEEAEDDGGDEEDSSEETAPEAKKEAKPKEDSEGDGEIDEKESESLLGLDPSELVTASGQPISKKTTEHIEKLKKHLDYFAKKAKRLKEQMGDFDPNAKKELAEIREAHGKLKKRFQDLYFEESEEWRESFVEPLSKADKEMTKWIKAHDIGDEEEAATILGPHMTAMQTALKKADEVMFWEHVDAIATHLKQGPSARFLKAAPDLWDAFQKREEAFKDKDKAREEIKKTSLSFAQQQTQLAEKSVDIMLNEFENGTNKPVIDAYKNDPKYKDYIDYDTTVTAKVKEAKEAIAIAVQQRKITPQLLTLVFNGALSGIREKEVLGYQERINQQKAEIARLEKKLEGKEALIGKVKPSSRQSSSSVTDEEDEEEVTSFAELFKKRMGK